MKPGQALYKVDNWPVVLIAGTIPLYRVLSTGLKGPDVRMLEANLRALGYTGFTVDGAFTAPTATAVKRWQQVLGLEQTGAVDVSQVTVASGAVRVSCSSASSTTCRISRSPKPACWPTTAPLWTWPNSWKPAI